MGILLTSAVLGVLPLAGIAWIGASGWLETMDGLFMSLILGAMAGVFLLNAGMQAKSLGLIPGMTKKEANGA